MIKGFNGVSRHKSVVDNSGHPMLAFRLSVLALFAAAAFSTQGTVLVYEGFHPEDYNNVAASDNVQANTTFKTNHTIGISTSGWNGMSGTKVRVFGENFGLAFPQKMTDAGFAAIGGSVGMSPSDNNGTMRSMYHSLATGVLHASAGTNLYVRMLVNLESAAGARLTKRNKLVANDGNYYACGFCIAPSSGDYHLLTHTRSAIAFLLWRNNDDQYVLSFGHTTAAEATATFYPLVAGITLGETYVCYAEIQVDAGSDANEIVRAGAVKASDFTGAVPWAALGGTSDSVETQLISASAYPVVMAVAGPYGTNGGKFRADEIVVGTEMKDILPVGGVFAISPTGAPTVEMNAFSTDWILVADQGVTANAGLVWSTDESFAIAATNSLGTGLAADTRTASLTGLEPDTTYWWKIYADNGTETVETSVGSFTTRGAPIFGTMTATVTGESAVFSVELAEAALTNTLVTPVSVFYGTDGQTWTELPLGSSATATNFSETVESLGYGVAYKWFARATATMEGGRVLSVGTVTNSFLTLWNGEMYVNADASNATTPYTTPETAAKTIAAALTVADDGATIHVAPGLYAISSPLEVRTGIRILGDEPDPSRTVVSNTTGTSNANQNKRVFILRHADALVANITMQKGEGYSSNQGGNFYISSAGGTVSNCVVEAGYVRDNAQGAGAYLDGGIVTHSVFRKNWSGSGSAKGLTNRGGLLVVNNSARVENCLFANNDQYRTVRLINLNDTSVMRNCTIVNSGLSATNEFCSSWSALNIASGVVVQNVVIAGVTNTVDGAKCKPTGTRANFVNGALDSSIEGTSFPADTVVGTAESFFKDYANGDYTLNPTSLLVNAGANYEGMASVDLAKKRRKVGPRIDIGCYELQSKGLTMVIR